MQTFFSFLKSKQFFLQFGIILILIFGVLFLTLKWLSSYTNHGEFVVVPDFKGQSIADLKDFVKDKNISYQIIDSIYDPKEKPGSVLRQDPETNTTVKHNRTIYLYVTGMVPPQVVMPKLVDRSERQARLIISSYGLKVGKVTEKNADCNGCVLSQMIKGKEIAAGQGVKKGSVIELLVGRKDNFYHSDSGDSTETDESNFE
jgi:eukaryotic-like serine/threonine-protein kinase